VRVEHAVREALEQEAANLEIDVGSKPCDEMTAAAHAESELGTRRRSRARGASRLHASPKSSVEQLASSLTQHAEREHSTFFENLGQLAIDVVAVVNNADPPRVLRNLLTCSSRQAASISSGESEDSTDS
jgi:hypothetical protein